MTERVHSGAPLAAGATVPGGEIYCDFSRGIVDRYKELAITLDRPAAAASSLTLSLESSHFLEPNEYTASRVVPHFKETDGGVHICTGSERFFSNAYYCPKKRDGFIGIDMDPQIKAYNELNTLLLILSDSPEDFLALASTPGEVDTIPWNQRLDVLRERLAKTTLSDDWKHYYTENLASFAAIYYPAKTDFFELCDNPSIDLLSYHTNQKAFLRLRALARFGFFVFLARDINQDLTRFAPIAECDISNICDYSTIHLQLAEPTRVIWTKGLYGGTTFYSYEHTSLPQEKVTQLEELISAVHRQVYRLAPEVLMDAPYMGRFDPRLDFAKLFLPTVHTNGVPLRNSYSLGTIERLTHISHLLEDDIASIPQEAWAFLMAEVAHLPVKILTALQKNEPKMLHIQKRFQEAYRTILSEPGRAVDPLRMRLLLNIMKR